MKAGGAFLPVQLGGEAVKAGAAHLLATRGIIEEARNGFRELHGIVFHDIDRSLASAVATLDGAKHDDGLREGHVLEHLVHGAVVVVSIDRITGDAEVDRLQGGAEKRITHTTWHADLRREAQLIPQAQESVILWSAAHEEEVHIGSFLHLHEVMRRFEQVLDAIRTAHHTDVADEVRFALLQGFIARRGGIESVRRGADDEGGIGVEMPTTRHRGKHALIRGDDDIRQRQRGPLGKTHGAVEQSTRIEFGLEHLRAEVMHIKDNAGAEEQLKGQSHEEEKVRRIAEVNHIEAATTAHRLPGMPKLADEGAGVFEEETERRAGLRRDPVAVDLNAIEHLLRLRVASHARADHRDLVTAIPQRTGFLPNPPVKGDREVFHEDEDSAAHGVHSMSLRNTQKTRKGE